MKKNKFLFIPLFYIMSLTVMISCNRPSVIYVDNRYEHIVRIDKFPKVGPLDFDNKIQGIRYVLLENILKKEIHIDKVVLSNDCIYILDKQKSLLLIFNINGGIKTVLNKIDAFDLYKGRLYTYQIVSGVMKIYSLAGSFLKQYQIGFRGVDFIHLNDSTYIFYTAGLVTKDKGSTKYELAYINQNSRLEKFGIPISEIKQGINYAATGRFSRADNKVYFIPSLENTMYELKSSKVTTYLKFDFGPFTLTDSAFKTFKDIEDYHFFPYVINITHRFSTPLYTFFSCDYRGTEAYYVIQNNTKRIVVVGLSGAAGLQSDFNNTIPRASNANEYLSVIGRTEFIMNYNLLRNRTGDWKKSRLSRLEKEKVVGNINPVLMFFKLKNISSGNDTAAIDFH